MGSQHSKEFSEWLKAHPQGTDLSIHVPFFVNEADAATLRKQWRKILLDGDRYGKKLFMELLKEDDIIVKFSFAIANQGDYDKTVNDARLIFHIRRVFTVITHVIDVLAPDKSVTDQLNWVGSLHKAHKVCQAHLQKFKKAFVNMMLERFPDDAERTGILWEHVMDFIIHHMMNFPEEVEADPEVRHMNAIKKRACSFKPNAY